MRLLSASIPVLITLSSTAQPVYHVVSHLPVYDSIRELAMPWFGGLNNPLFSDIDLDDDGIQDLWIFEASEGHFYTFKNLGITDSVSYRFAPEYIPNFPHAPAHPWQSKPVLHDWAWLVDYNCDGIEDIFSHGSAGAQVYRGSRDGNGNLQFEFVTIQIKYKEGIYWTNIYMSSLDYPAFTDIDGDTDLDILAFPLLGDKIEFYENQSAQMGYGCDSLIFFKDCRCWGYVVEHPTKFTFTMNQSCPCLTGSQPDAGGGPRHAGGSSLLPFDQDDDGDIELIVSDPGFDNLVYLHNGKTGSRDSITSLDTLFPSYDLPVDLPVFPAASMLDINNDQFEDILVAPMADNYCRIMPGFQDTAINRMAVWYYKGAAPSGNKTFGYDRHDVFVRDFIDVGDNSSPAFFDYNADGLLDIVVGNCYAFNEHEQLNFGLTLYENTGTVTDPQFTFVTEDYAELSVMQLFGLSPTFGDIDNDGDLDLVCGTISKLMRFENIAGPSNPAQFTFHSEIVDSFFYGSRRTPQLVDADRDGFTDLIVGDEDGKIYYYRNTGTATSPVFTRITNQLGGVDVTAAGSFAGYSAPQLVQDGTGGAYRLYVGSLAGYVHVYDSIDGNLSGSFHLVTKTVADTFFGARTVPAMADINADGQLELLLGNRRGGLVMATQSDWTVGVAEHSPICTSVYPNPASNWITISLSETDETGWHIQLTDITGKIIYTRSASGSKATVDLADMSAGIYLFTATGKHFTASKQVIITR